MDQHSCKTLQHVGQLQPKCIAHKIAQSHSFHTARPAFGEASASKKARHSKTQRRLHITHSAAVEEMTEAEIEHDLEGTHTIHASFLTSLYAEINKDLVRVNAICNSSRLQLFLFTYLQPSSVSYWAFRSIRCFCCSEFGDSGSC